MSYAKCYVIYIYINNVFNYLIRLRLSQLQLHKIEWFNQSKSKIHFESSLKQNIESPQSQINTDNSADTSALTSPSSSIIIIWLSKLIGWIFRCNQTASCASFSDTGLMYSEIGSLTISRDRLHSSVVFMVVDLDHISLARFHRLDRPKENSTRSLKGPETIC